MNSQKFQWRVFFEDQKNSLLFFVKKKTNTTMSNRSLKKMIEKGFCLVNSRVERFASYSLKEGDVICLKDGWSDFLQETEEKKVFKILYEDDFFCIIDKPTGVVSEIESLKKLWKKDFLPIHRLDKETSGVWMLAKTEEIKESMKELFLQKEVKKSYIAIVEGTFIQKSGKIENYLLKKSCYEGQTIWKGSNKNKKASFYALTYWKELKPLDQATALLCFPITGRTHQLRVHLSEMGHPILGDFQYCRKFSYPYAMPRLFLHSFEISFEHPVTKEKVCVKAPLPELFFSKNFLKRGDDAAIFDC